MEFNPVDVLRLALDDINRDGGWTCKAYEDDTGARCMLGAIAHIEHGRASYHRLSRNSMAWRYVMKAAKKQYPLNWKLRVMFSHRRETAFPERMIIKFTGGGWKAKSMMRMALKMAEKDAQIDADHKVAKEAERIVDSAAEAHSAAQESAQREYGGVLY